jgi:hypothetical protein
VTSSSLLIRVIDLGGRPRKVEGAFAPEAQRAPGREEALTPPSNGPRNHAEPNAAIAAGRGHVRRPWLTNI